MDRLRSERLRTLEPAEEPPAQDLGRQSFAELTATNDRLREDRGWLEIDLDAALTPDQRVLFARWQSRQRVPWAAADLV